MAGRSGSTIDLPSTARCVDLSPVRLYRKDSLQVVAPERRTSVMGMPSSTWRTEATPDAPPHGRIDSLQTAFVAAPDTVGSPRSKGHSTWFSENTPEEPRRCDSIHLAFVAGHMRESMLPLDMTPPERKISYSQALDLPTALTALPSGKYCPGAPSSLNGEHANDDTDDDFVPPSGALWGGA